MIAALFTQLCLTGSLMKVRTLVSLFSVFLISLIVVVSCTPAQKTTSDTNTATTVTANTPIQMGFSAWTGWIP